MTSTPVKEAGALMNFMGARAAKTPGIMTGQTDSFNDIMNKASGEAKSQSSQDKTGQITGKDLKDTQVNNSYPPKETPKAEGSNQPAETEDALTRQEQAVKEAGDKLVKEMAEELGVTEEDVLRAMEQLGFGITALFDAENLTKLALTLAGEESPLALLTNEGLYSHVQNLLQSLSEVKSGLGNELAMSQEELSNLLGDMQKMEESTVEEMPKPEGTKHPEGEIQDKNDPGKEPAKITVTVEENGESIKLSADENGNVEQVETVVKEEMKTASEKQSGHQQEKGNTDGRNQGEGNLQTGNPLLDALLQNKVQSQEVSFEQTQAFVSGETEEIMNQILDYMKIQLKPGMDQLEMQLHPASLGTVHVQIASKGGEITAQFHVQNEAVKAAIESQMVELKDSLKEQGLKVEAVEVSVESHAFESNLWQGRGRDEDASSYRGQKKTPRKINLNQLDELFEAQAGEEEVLAAKIMEANGNSVDYTA